MDPNRTRTLSTSAAASADPERGFSFAVAVAAPAPVPASGPVVRAAAPPLGTTIDDRLLFASAAGDCAHIEALLAEGAAVNYQRVDGVSSLHAAAWSGPAVRLLLAAGANPNIRNKAGDTPLIVAASKKATEAVELLLAHGADITCKRANNATALHVAAATGSAAVVEILLRHGADPCDRNAALDTSLIVAAAVGGVDAVRVLCAEPRVKDFIDLQRENGATALSFACTKRNVEAIEVLLAAGASVNIANSNEDSPIIIAADAGSEEIIRRLLAAGANPCHQRINGASALHVAAGRGFLSSIGLLLAAGVPVDIENKDKETPLLVALARGHIEAVDMLLRAGASTNIVSTHGVTVFDLAIRDIALWKKILTSGDSVGFLMTQTASFQRIVSVLFDMARHRDHRALELFLAFAGSAKQHVRGYLVWLIDNHRSRLVRGFDDTISALIMRFIGDPDATVAELQARFH